MNDDNIIIEEVPLRTSEFKRIITIFFGRKLSAFGFTIIFLLILTAIFAPLIAPYDPYKMDLRSRYLQPNSEHLLGTDSLGRDTLSRVIYGARTSLMITILAVTCGSVIGQLLGLIAAYFGGKVYALIMRTIDAILCLPQILVALIISTTLGPGIKNLIIALGFGIIAPQARLMCGQALTVMQNDYILASRARGASDIRLMITHVVPNAFPPLLVMITTLLGTTIIAEASLSFIGVGIEPPTAAWGTMVNEGYEQLVKIPILSFAPGLAIMLVVFGFQMMGDGLRDALDPRLRGTL